VTSVRKLDFADSSVVSVETVRNVAQNVRRIAFVGLLMALLVAGAAATKPPPPVIYCIVGVSHLHATESTGTNLK